MENIMIEENYTVISENEIRIKVLIEFKSHYDYDDDYDDFETNANFHKEIT